jgi:hypothetical protein
MRTIGLLLLGIVVVAGMLIRAFGFLPWTHRHGDEGPVRFGFAAALAGTDSGWDSSFLLVYSQMIVKPARVYFAEVTDIATCTHPLFCCCQTDMYRLPPMV